MNSIGSGRLALLLAAALVLSFVVGRAVAEEKGATATVQVQGIGDANKAISGDLTITNAGSDSVKIIGTIKGLKKGKHGFHIHESSAFNASTAPGFGLGSHYDGDPSQGHHHGGPDAADRHAGDLGNLDVPSDGAEVKVDITAKGLQVSKILNRSVVIHAAEDTLKPVPEASAPKDQNGNAGARIAWGKITSK